MGVDLGGDRSTTVLQNGEHSKRSSVDSASHHTQRQPFVERTYWLSSEGDATTTAVLLDAVSAMLSATLAVY